MRPNLILIPLVTIITAALGSFFTSSGMEWYQTTITRPSITPPDYIFGIAWTTIFILATISALIVWNKTKKDRRFKWTIAIFIANAILNILWCFLFFYQHQIFLAIPEAALLALTVLALIILIWPRSKTAAALLLPYFLWVSFATFLTYSIWTLNS